MSDVFLVTINAEIKRRSELSKQASDAYRKLKDKDSRFANSILELIELHNSIYTVCTQAKAKYERDNPS